MSNVSHESSQASVSACNLADEQLADPDARIPFSAQQALWQELDARLPAAEIALLLGYSEPSVFFRAFRQWTGLTPGVYRTRHHAG